MMAEIFNSLDRQAETRFLAALEERNRESPPSASVADVHLRGPAAAEPPAMQVLLRAVEKDKLPIALKGASESCATCSSRACRTAPARS
jgi:flagellar motor switch protein FliG